MWILSCSVEGAMCILIRLYKEVKNHRKNPNGDPTQCYTVRAFTEIFHLDHTELSTIRDYLMLFCDKNTKQYMQPVTRQ